LVLTTREASADREAMLRSRGVEIERAPADSEGHVDLPAALELLAKRGLTRVFSEGGPHVGSRLVAQGLADEVVLLTATKPLGRRGLPALDARAYAALEDSARYRELEKERYEPDEMRIWESRG
jgi:diaminohydroxyphosphoribosylaminopyrimidine deaminase/5-amino-6-(5-phosphoribosylamino)uracil reductase